MEPPFFTLSAKESSPGTLKLKKSHQRDRARIRVVRFLPTPTNAWLGGNTTLPYQYSNEPEHRFKQMAGNITPTSGHPFMHGRRLHHTDFATGVHSEPGNPVFEAYRNRAGTKRVSESCVSCHVNNGRDPNSSTWGCFRSCSRKARNRGPRDATSPHGGFAAAQKPT